MRVPGISLDGASWSVSASWAKWPFHALWPQLGIQFYHSVQLHHPAARTGLCTCLCNWILHCFISRSQSVQIGNNISSSITIYTGAHDSQLVPQLQPLYTHDWARIFFSDRVFAPIRFILHRLLEFYVQFVYHACIICICVFVWVCVCDAAASKISNCTCTSPYCIWQ